MTSPSVSREKQAELIAEHYQQTFQLTHEMWKQRNLTLLRLLATIGVASVLLLGPPETFALIVQYLASQLNLEGADEVSRIRQLFSFTIIQSLVLFVIFYLMVNLHHRALYVLRNYAYLGQLELEIRRLSGMAPDSIAFTREGSFYWGHRGSLQGIVKWVYVFLLGGLLLFFLVGSIVFGFQSGNMLTGFANLGIALPIMLFFFAYAKSSVIYDSQEDFTGEAAEDASPDA